MDDSTKHTTDNTCTETGHTYTHAHSIRVETNDDSNEICEHEHIICDPQFVFEWWPWKCCQRCEMQHNRDNKCEPS